MHLRALTLLFDPSYPPPCYMLAGLFQGNPDQENPPPANRTVTVTVKHAAGQAPATATLYVIDAVHTNPRGLWTTMGSPKTPDADQLKQLMQASEWTSRPATVSSSGATSSAVEVEMSENSAVVVAFGA